MFQLTSTGRIRLRLVFKASAPELADTALKNISVGTTPAARRHVTPTTATDAAGTKVAEQVAEQAEVAAAAALAGAAAGGLLEQWVQLMGLPPARTLVQTFGRRSTDASPSGGFLPASANDPWGRSPSFMGCDLSRALSFWSV